MKGAGVPHTLGRTRNVHVLRVRGAHDTGEHGWGHEVQHAQPQAWELRQEAVVHEQIWANACSKEHTTIGAQSAKHRSPDSPKSVQTAHKPDRAKNAKAFSQQQQGHHQQHQHHQQHAKSRQSVGNVKWELGCSQKGWQLASVTGLPILAARTCANTSGDLPHEGDIST